MKHRILLLPALVILLCVLVAGCATGPGTGTPAPTAAPPATAVVATATAPAAVTAPEPVRGLPPERQVSLALTKDRPRSEIHLLFQGGPGERFVQRILMRVYTTETAYREYEMSPGKKPLPGDEIIAPGTRGDDRCEVFVISAGTRYKVMDERVIAGGYY